MRTVVLTHWCVYSYYICTQIYVNLRSQWIYYKIETVFLLQEITLTWL